MVREGKQHYAGQMEKTQKLTFKSQEGEVDLFKNQKPAILHKVIEWEKRHKIEKHQKKRKKKKKNTIKEK